jgi:hypothetical protein
MTQSILQYVYNSYTINSAFNRFIKDSERDEFKQHIYLELLTLKSDKLEKAYTGGWLDLLVYRMMKNQYLSNNSPWAKKVRDSNHQPIDDEYVDLGSNGDICPHKLKLEVLRILDSRKWQKNNFLKKQYHNVLFRMYFWDKKTYKEIELLTNIKSTTARASIQETLEYVRKNINMDNLID